MSRSFFSLIIHVACVTIPTRRATSQKNGTPSKTHTFDDSVILDRPDMVWMDRLWQALIVGRPDHARLIPMDQNEIAREVETIFEELGCSKLGVVAYSLRHGGPSWDFMKKFRNLDEIQQRGRCSPTSVLRYQKASKLLTAMQLCDAIVQAVGGDEKEGKDGGNVSAQGGANELRVRREVRVSCTKSPSLQHGDEERRS